MKKIIQPMRKLVLIILISITYLSINISCAQTIYPVYYHVITLQKDSIKLNNSDFYIKAVVDCRPDTTNIGYIKDGLFDSKYPAKLDTNLYLSLKKYFDELLPVKKEKTPVLIKITYFNISEMADANRDNGKTEIKMEFYTESNNYYTKIYETAQSVNYTYSDVTKLHEKYIREMLKKSIKEFANAKNKYYNSEKISYKQLIYVDTINIAYTSPILFIKKAYYSKINFNASGGFGYYFGEIPQEMPKELKNYIKGMRFAYNYATEFIFFLSNDYGIGFNYANYSSKNSIDYFRIYKDDEHKYLKDEGSILNDINIKRYGPSLNYRSLLSNSNTFFKAALSFERIHYIDDAILFSKPNKIETTTSGLVGQVGLDYYIFKNVALNCSLSALWGKIKEMEVNGVPTELSKKTSLLRSDLNVGITLCY